MKVVLLSAAFLPVFIIPAALRSELSGYDLYSSWGNACMTILIIFATFRVYDFTKHHEYQEIKSEVHLLDPGAFRGLTAPLNHYESCCKGEP